MNRDIDWAVRQKAPAPCKHVLIVLANRAGKDHSCYPSLTSIAEDTGMARRSVVRCLNTLEILALIRRKQRGINSTLYTLLVGTNSHYPVGTHSHHSTPISQQRKVGTDSHHQQGPTVTRDPQSLGTDSHRGSDRQSLPVGTHSHTEPPIEPKVNPKKGDLHKRTRAPDSILITESMRNWAAKNGVTVSLESETERMLDYHRAKGTLFSDWIAGWRTWMANSVKFERNRGNGNGRPKDKQQINRENSERLLARFDRENREAVDHIVSGGDSENSGSCGS